MDNQNKVSNNEMSVKQIVDLGRAKTEFRFYDYIVKFKDLGIIFVRPRIELENLKHYYNTEPLIIINEASKKLSVVRNLSSDTLLLGETTGKIDRIQVPAKYRYMNSLNLGTDKIIKLTREELMTLLNERFSSKRVKYILEHINMCGSYEVLISSFEWLNIYDGIRTCEINTLYRNETVKFEEGNVLPEIERFANR